MFASLPTSIRATLVRLRALSLFRALSRASVAAAALFLGLALWGALLRPASGQMTLDEEVSAQARHARDVSFAHLGPDELPRIQRDVDYELGESAPWFPRGQAPVLAELEDEGVLPSVEERVGPEPLVLDGGEIGKYGGTWLRAATSDFDVFIIEYRFGYSSLFRWSPLGHPIVPHLATRLETSEDQRSFVVHLRKGVRWSDGHPYTADDLIYWWKHEDLSETVGDEKPALWLSVGGGKTTIEKIDDHSLRFSFEHPYGNFLENLAAFSLEMSAAPAHYLKKYHPDLGDRAFIEREMKSLGFSSPRSLYAAIKRFSNPACPRLWPWVPRAHSSSSPYVFVRNPYYFAVDPAGNQLPYIDRLQFDVRSSQMLGLAVAGGQVTMQGRHIKYENYTELMARQDDAGFRVLHWYPASRSSWVIHPNLNRLVREDDPSTAPKAKLLGDKRFRQALSLAIDREAIIQAEYNGQVEAAQVEPGPESAFHHPELRKAFVKYDPARASVLLDELGLTRRDLDGMRTFPDGSTMTFYLNFSPFTGIGPGQFVVDDWGAVGVRAIAREQARTLFYTKKDASDFDFMVWVSESDFFPLLEPRLFAPPNAEAFFATRWGRWFNAGGFHHPEDLPSDRRIQGPPRDHPMFAAYQAYVDAIAAPTPEEQVARFSKALDIAAENLWTINIADAPPFLVVVDDDLKNVPKRAMYGNATRTPANAGLETYFFQHPRSDAFQETKAVIKSPASLPRGNGSTFGSNGDEAHGRGKSGVQHEGATMGAWLGALVRWTFALVALGFLVLASLRHPFVIRRVFVLVPTLLVISVVVFSIVQLPPGDFLSARVAALEETGDSAALAEIEDLKEVFHYDEPDYQKYARWMGLFWFFSFDDRDAGLLQGDLGTSMETGRPVSEMVGDRVLLTVVISFVSLLLTWLLAIPIGVYSAVKQYSFFDYLFTFLGFLGMSIPPFLLALILMVLSGVSGLFSPDFASQPGWSMGKVFDLLAHIWVPLLVMAITGTAGMIRVMRANLLDELSRSYVVAARARGLRPLKLLFKYPVRVALNPFVSGIGHLFPQLVSGGAIVAIVLSLPTVGPLQISALLNEDMYLAGSMLMVLSLLSVFGTLVADLLLLALDPRIRYESLGAS